MRIVWYIFPFLIYVFAIMLALSARSKLCRNIILTVGVFLEAFITILFYALDIGG